MGTYDRLRKKTPVWKKALIHFSLCFATGFFTGFVPSSSTTVPISSAPNHREGTLGVVAGAMQATGSLNRTLLSEIPIEPSPPRRLLIVVTTTRSGDRMQAAFMRRLAHTLRLVPPPVLWAVVEASADAPATAELLRRTGVMYRHLTFKKNQTDVDGTDDCFQQNLALAHVERHRLDGVVHFAAPSSVYDLDLFDDIRRIEVAGSWPAAMLSAGGERPIGDEDSIIDASGFAFNSSVLWDQERWGRSSSSDHDISQDSMGFVEQVVLEEEMKMRGIPTDCTRVKMWQLNMQG